MLYILPVDSNGFITRKQCYSIKWVVLVKIRVIVVVLVDCSIPYRL